MNVKIQKASTDGVTDNKGSCRQLTEYMNHEDEERLAEGKQPLLFVTPTGLEVSIEEVISKIDRNHKGLSAKDDKFYSLIISPSENEIKAMGTTDEEVYHSGLKLIRVISDAYAENFNREGIVDSSDLLIYWKPHFTRGENGDLQFHIHGVVSRRAKGNGPKLSPMTNHRNTENGAVKGGFDRKHFFKKCERLFDKLFNYERQVAETFDYCNAQAHGTPEQKAEQAELLVKEQQEHIKANVVAGLERRRESIRKKNQLEELAEMLASGAVEKAVVEQQQIDTVDFASLSNDIAEAFFSSSHQLALDMKLASLGITCRPIIAPNGGVKDLLFTKLGNDCCGADILDAHTVSLVLKKWEKVTGNLSEVSVQAMLEAQAAERELKEYEKLKEALTPKYKITHHR